MKRGMKLRNFLRGAGSILNIMPRQMKRLSFDWLGGNITPTVPGQINFEREHFAPIQTSLQVQVTATFETPCCREEVVLAKHFEGGQVEYPVAWAGIACPKCQTIWAIKLEQDA